MTNNRNESTEAVDQERLPYEAPRILSVETLEAVAAVCSPQTGVFGKEIPPCSTLGS